ncbi:MAG: response regulator [Flavisolibacter sp.]
MKAKLNCVLVIDDDEPTNYFNTMIVEQSGCTDKIKVAQSGQEALEYLATSVELACQDDIFPCPDLIFLDINMPAMDGWEFLDQYRQMKRERRTQVIVVMLTTSLFQEDMQRAKGIPEITAFENKPLTPEKLDRILQRHFDSLRIEQ